MSRRFLLLLVILFAVASVAQQGPGNECTIAGTWYGGSVVAYQMTIIPIQPAGHYMVLTQAGFTDAKFTTMYSGISEKKGDGYEGTFMQFYSDNEAFTTAPPTILLFPDLRVGYSIMKLTDCNTISNYIPFFGVYFGYRVWAGEVTPFVSPLDFDFLDLLSNGKPIRETYHRIPNSINPALLHHD